MDCFDVGIIGAGPGGTYAAYWAAKSGLRVAVFEEHQKVGEPVHCGECLSKLATERLGLQLPQEAVSCEVEGIKVVWPNKKYSFIREPGYTLEKDKFEQYLAKLGEEHGATYLLKHRVSGLKRDGQWRIETTKGQYCAKIVIDASGVAAAASTLLGLNPQMKTVIGLQYELSDMDFDGFVEFFLWPSLAPHGYLWIIPKSGRRANVGLVTADLPNTRSRLEKFVFEYGLGQKRKVGKIAFGGKIPASGPVPKTYDDGLLLVGDAAGFTSPMFEGGTALAMTSGKFAAEVAAQAVKKANFTSSFLFQYEKMWKAEFPDYSALLKGKEAAYRYTDEEWSKIGDTIPQDLTNLSAAQKLAIGAKVLFGAPGIFFKGFIPAMEALGKSRAKYYGW
ncbi:MAG: NAD(P)/FAD-dependent oxidoreductase [Candidatus Anstonellaceae archaeon]